MSTMRRLLDEPGDDLDRALLEAGLDEEPPPRAAERALAALGLGTAAVVGTAAVSTGVTSAALGGAGTSGAAAGAAKASGLFGLTLAKVLGGVAVVSAVGVGGYVLSQRQAPQPVAASQPQPAPEQPAVVAGEAPADSPRAVEPGPSDAVRASEPAAVQTAAPRAKPRSPKPKGAEAEGSVGGSLGAEAALLDQARRAELAGDVEACRARIAAYRSRFPAGQLAKDASAIKCKAPK